MTANIETFHILLESMRADFLAELPERCDDLEAMTLALENTLDNRDTYQNYFRAAHSLKGLGGTHGLPIITTLCHQLENLLTEAEADADAGFDTVFTNRALALIDLLRQSALVASQERPDYTSIEADLDEQRSLVLQRRSAVLIAESSRMMSGLCQKALEGLPLQLTVVDNGLTALERLLLDPFDLFIVARELKVLNGVGVAAALRASQSRNREIPILLLSSSMKDIPSHAKFSAIIARDQQLVDKVSHQVMELLAGEH
jgi:chemotaxis protein histidine kinase CheA